MNKELQKLQKMLQSVFKAFNDGEDYAKADEVVEIFKEIEGALKAIKEYLEDKIVQASSDVLSEVKTNKKEIDTLNVSLDTNVSYLEGKISTQIASIKALIPKMPDMPNVKALENKIILDFTLKLEELKKAFPTIEIETAGTIREKLESLKGNDRIDKSSIRGLEEELKRIESTSGGSRGMFRWNSGLQVFGGGSKVGAKSLEIDFGSGLTATDVNGRISVIASGAGGGSTAIDNEVVAGFGTAFSLASYPVVGSVKVYGLGQRLIVNTDYSINSNNITTFSSWSTGEIISDYLFDSAIINPM